MVLIGKNKFKIGYLSKVKSKGKTYIYIRVSERYKDDSGKSIVRKRNIFSFGCMPKALDNMYYWRDNPEMFPDELKEMGYNLNDLYEWILTIETQITSTGKEFNL